MTSRIIGTGSCTPAHVVTNDDLAQVVETSDEWISSRTGIRERRIAIEETAASLSAEAARRALEDAGIAAEELDIIILATTSPDHCFPSAACEVQGAIGAVNAIAYDLSAACTGYIYALNTMQAFIQAGIYKTGLVIGTDILSRLVDWRDRSTCVLFGDGSGATVVRAEETGILHMVMGSDGKRGPVLSCASRTNGDYLVDKKPELGYLYMDGQEVFKFAVKTVPECINRVLRESGTEIDEIRYFILHQANARIFESVAKRLKQPIEKFPMNISSYGNTSGASVPLMLDELNRQGKLNAGDKIMVAGFGAGLTWGATLLQW